MAVVVALGLSGMLLALQPIPIDFKIDGSFPPTATAIAPATQAVNEQPLTLDAPGPLALQAAPSLPQAVVRPVLARGFGRNVPLGFAIKQIVPASLHVDFDSMVDQDARVSWVGGKPWREVLHTTLMPLGIHAVQSGHTVRITE